MVVVVVVVRWGVAAMRTLATCSVATCWLLGMSILCAYATAAYFTYCRIFTYFSKVRILHIFFPRKLAFSTAILILFVLLLPISIRFR